MEQIISKMGMQNARFRIDLTSVDHFLSNGKEQIDFLFSANLGSDFKPIKKVASGGDVKDYAFDQSNLIPIQTITQHCF